MDMDPETYWDGPEMAGPTSRKSRDLAALKQLGTWLDNPVNPSETTIVRRRDEMFDHFIEVRNKRSGAIRAQLEASVKRAKLERNETAD